MNKLVLIGFFISISSFALPPPQGKSMREDKNYQNVDAPIGSFLDPISELPRKLDKPSQEEKEIDKKPLKKKSVKSTERGKVKSKIENQGLLSDPFSNLPVYHQIVDRSNFKSSDQVMYVSPDRRVKLKGLKSGDKVMAVIEDEIKVSPSSPQAIRAIAISSAFKGSIFLGEATLEPDLKRVRLNFNKLRIAQNDQVFLLNASGSSPKGGVGLEGEYSSQSGRFFVAELLSAAAAGWVDSTVGRQQNSFGGYVQEPSLANSAKQGLTNALSRSAERNAESARQAPEYTEISGFQEIQILVKDDPIEAEQ